MIFRVPYKFLGLFVLSHENIMGNLIESIKSGIVFMDGIISEQILILPIEEHVHLSIYQNLTFSFHYQCLTASMSSKFSSLCQVYV